MADSASPSPHSSKSSPFGENTFKPHTKPNPLKRFGCCLCFGFSSRVKIDARFDLSDIREILTLYFCRVVLFKVPIRSFSCFLSSPSQLANHHQLEYVFRLCGITFIFKIVVLLLFVVEDAGTQTAEISFTSDDIVRAVSEDAMGYIIMKDIQLGTRNFSNDFKIDQGGFRTAYKGRLKDEILVAMERREEELRPDISNLALTNHANLVRLLGFLESGNQRIAIHEIFPNVTLREYLDGGRLDFYSLSSVAVDVASGVMHLHNSTDRHPIIHGDINSSNILITDDFHGKVKLATHEISPIIKGIAGYSFGELMEKDVCSFGELLVEMILGWRATKQNRKKKESDTTCWAMKKLANGSAKQVLDPGLTHDAAAIVASEKILHLAKQCLAKTGKARPTMSVCETMLQRIRWEYKNTHSSSS